MACSMKYPYRRYFKDKAIETEPMRMGSASHELIERYWRTEREANGNLERICNKYNVKDTSRVGLFLDNFFRYFRPLLSIDDTIEEFFKVPIGDFTEGKVYMVGKWDRVVGGTLFDWKTNKKVPFSIDRDIQFIIYYNSYLEKTGRKPNALYFASLGTGRLIKYKPNRDYINILYKQIIPNMIEAIESQSFVKEGLFKYFSPCGSCSFKEHCWNELAG